jgi:hypothetical protein
MGNSCQIRSEAMSAETDFLQSIAGVWWGAQLRCMLLLYKGLIGSVLDYALVCYSGMGKTHMLRVERVQYRGIRLASFRRLFGVFSAKLIALFMALRHIREVIQLPAKCLILTNSLGSIKAMLSRRTSWRTHPLVYV